MNEARLLVAALACAAASGAWAFERTKGELCETCLYWSQVAPAGLASRDLRYLVHADGSRSTSCAGAPGLAAVQAGFAAWTGPSCSHLAVAYAGSTGDGRVGLDGWNLVVFRAGPCEGRIDPLDPCWASGDGACANAYGCWEGDALVFATTVVTHSASSGAIHDADIEVNDWGGDPGGLPGVPGPADPPADGWYFTCDPPPGGTTVPPLCNAYGQTGCAYADLQNTIAHEAGHVIGLAHPSLSPDATMYAQAGLGEIMKRDLDADDVAGLCAIYPAGGLPTSCPGRNLPECVGCGCRSAGAGGALALVALLLALAPRARRPVRG